MKDFLKMFVNYFLLFFCSVCLVTYAADQKCVPGAVSSVTFSDYQLKWSAAANVNNCTIAQYVIYVRDLEAGTLQMYEKNAAVNNTYDFSILEMCNRYSFEVVAKTNESVLGSSSAVEYTTAPKAGMDLNITIDSSEAVNNSISISWEMEQANTTKCVSYYRLVVWNETNTPTDIYVESLNYTLTNISPCMPYEFQVRAIIVNPEIEGPFSLVRKMAIGAPTTPPVLQSISTTSTGASMIWQLEEYSKNRCEIKFIVVETVPNIIVTVPVTDSTDRSPVRVDLTNLKPNTVYISEVYVINSVGNSSKVTITYQTSDVDLENTNMFWRLWNKFIN